MPETGSHDLSSDAARVLVTGGAGFVGSYLVPSLLDRGASVMVIDDLSRGRKEHLDGLGDDGRLELFVGDIRDEESALAAADFSPEIVFHIGAIHFIPYCVAHPKETLHVNVLGSDRLFRALRSSPVRSVVYTSSAAVYGYGDAPHTEQSPVRPADIHGISKWMCEEVLARFHEERPDTRCVAARLFNVYGPRETNPHVLPAIMEMYRKGERVPIGNLWPRRDYIFAQDVADALIRLSDGDPGWEVFNLGTGVGTTVVDMLTKIGELTGRPPDYMQVADRVRSDDGHLVSDNRRIRERTGWEPAYDIERGLTELLRWEGLLEG